MEAKGAWKEAHWDSGLFKLPPGNYGEHIPITPGLDRTKPTGDRK